MKKIIAFSLWGTNPKYTIGAIKNADLIRDIYPGWIARFYCGKSVPNNIVEDLQSKENCEVVLMDVAGDWRGMFWRFYPASEDDVDVMLSRDCDSRLDLREKKAVDEWMETNKSFHIMRDHPYHTTQILGGMWGVRGNILKNMRNMINDYVKGSFWQVDQNFLKELIYNIIKEDCIVHDSYLNYEPFKKRFPTKRIGSAFVGESFDEFDNPNITHRKMIT